MSWRSGATDCADLRRILMQRCVVSMQVRLVGIGRRNGVGGCGLSRHQVSIRGAESAGFPYVPAMGHGAVHRLSAHVVGGAEIPAGYGSRSITTVHPEAAVVVGQPRRSAPRHMAALCPCRPPPGLTATVPLSSRTWMCDETGARIRRPRSCTGSDACAWKIQYGVSCYDIKR